MSAMRTYTTRKTVQAGVFIRATPLPNGNTWVDLEPSEGFRLAGFEDGGDLFKRGSPEPGDYVVFYEDGYRSWCPKAAFEASATLEA